MSWANPFLQFNNLLALDFDSEHNNSRVAVSDTIVAKGLQQNSVEVTVAYKSKKAIEHQPQLQINIPSSPDSTLAQNDVKLRSRKRKRNESNWKCNIRKHNRATGKAYEAKKGKLVSERKLKPPCLTSCKKKCREKFDEKARTNIFASFWKEGTDINFKRQFVAGCVLKAPVSRRTTILTSRKIKTLGSIRETTTADFPHETTTVDSSHETTTADVPHEITTADVSRRNSSLSYHFEHKGKRLQVCKTFFLNTLCISESFVKTALEKKSDVGIVLLDQRGKKVPPNKLPDEMRQIVKDHISSFPTFESQRSKQKTPKKYLSAELSLSRMYSLYMEHCNAINLDPKLIAKAWLYYDIFNHEFNLSFRPQIRLKKVNSVLRNCEISH